MPRLNVYLSEETFKLAERWRGKINLSEICARALAEELEAREADRAGKSLLLALRRPSAIERELVAAYGLKDAVVSAPVEPEPVRETLGRSAAEYLSRTLTDGAQLAIAGGRQMWAMVSAFQPRPLRISVAALGVRHNDPRVLHAHSNTLATMLWLLFSPRAEARLVGDTNPPFEMNPVESRELRYFVVGSCARYEPLSPFAKLLETKVRRHFTTSHVYGDFAYQFFDQAGRPVSIPGMYDCKFLEPEEHRALVKRDDARVVVVAGGPEKLGPLQRTLDSRLCNAVVTDEDTARKLLKTRKP